MGEDLINIAGIFENFFAAFSHVRKVVPIGIGEAFFEIAVTAATALVIGDHGLEIRFARKEFIEGDDGGVLGGFGIFDWRGVGDDFHHQFAQLFFLTENR